MDYRFDALVYLALAAVIIVVIAAAVVIVWVPENSNLETRKIRFAAATFTGILLLFVFAASLYFAGNVAAPGPIQYTCPCQPPNPGKDIFEKGVAAMFTLAGSIVGYLFGTSRRGATGESPKN